MNLTFNKIARSSRRIMPLWRDKAEHYKCIVIVENGKSRKAVRVSVKYPKDGAGILRAVVWVMSERNGWQWGAGSANGYGYCKLSTAIASACADAGALSGDNCAGRGEGAVLELLQAIAQADTDTLLTSDSILFI